MSVLPVVRMRHKEPIQMVARRHNYFPKRFMWRGNRYEVDAVERTWTEMKRSGGQHFFRVHCAEGIFDIFQDVSLNAWYLAAQVE